MPNQLTKLAPGWHQEAAHLLNENFEKIHLAFTDATKRAVWMGMFLNHLKAKGKEDGSIPHGQFLPWLEKAVPSVTVRTAQTYMSLAVGVCEKGSFQIREFSVFADLPGHLPPKIEKAIEGKTQQQLFLSFKNVDAEGEPMKPGSSPGVRGQVSFSDQVAAQRARAKQLVDEVCKALWRLQDDWTALPDADNEILDIYLDKTLRAVRLWKKTPLNKRHEIAADVKEMLKP